MRIKTDKGDLNLYKGFNYSFNYSVQELTDITKRKTSFSKDIKIPATEDNLLIFGLADLIDAEFTNFEPLEKLNCQVINDSAVVFEGFIQLDSVDFNGVEKSINIILYSNTISLIDAIKGVKLNTLDWSEYDHTYSFDLGGDVFNSIDGTIKHYGVDKARKEGSGYIYPIANYGTFDRTLNKFETEDIRPAIFLKEYIDKIFNFAGIGYESKFFETPYFKSLVVPCTSEFTLSDGEADERSVEAKEDPLYSYNYPFTTIQFPFIDEKLSIYGTEVRDDLNQFASNKFTALNGGIYNVVASTQYNVNVIIPDTRRWQGSDIVLEIRVYKNGILYDSNDLLESPNPLIIRSDGSYNFGYNFDINSQVTTNAGDEIEVKYYYKRYIFSAPSLGVLTDFAETNHQFSNNKLSITYSEENTTIQLGSDFKFSNAVPSIDADKFLKSIITLFNLYILEQKDGKLRIETRDEFYNSKLTHNWTYKHDLSKAYSLEIASKDIPRYYGFKYNNEDSPYLVETSNEFNENTFEYSNDFEISPIENTNFGANLPNMEGAKLRLLFYNGVNTTEVDYAGVNSYKCATISNDLIVNSNKEFTLNYDSAIYFNAYNLFYLNTINDLKSNNSKIFTGYFNLSNLDINSLSLRDRIYFKGNYWRILNISNFNPESDESVKVELFKLDGNESYLTPEDVVQNVYNNGKIFGTQFNNIFA